MSIRTKKEKKPFYFVLPFADLESSSWPVELSVFFFLVTAVPFLSKVIGLYCGRLLNFLSNSSSSLPRLKSRAQSSYRWPDNQLSTQMCKRSVRRRAALKVAHNSEAAGESSRSINITFSLTKHKLKRVAPHPSRTEMSQIYFCVSG